MNTTESWSLGVRDIRHEPLDNSGALSICTPPRPIDQEDIADMEDDDNPNDSDASDQPRRDQRPKKPHLQGRFSGRLEAKTDEKRLADECRLLGPLLGGVGKRGERSRMTLAKIVRGIASGDVRSFCEDREGVIQVGFLSDLYELVHDWARTHSGLSDSIPSKSCHEPARPKHQSSSFDLGNSTG